MKNRNLPAAAVASLLLWIPVGARCQEDPDAALEVARRGQVEEALAIVDSTLAATPDDARALFARGVILAEAGRHEAAEAAFRRLIERHPGLPEAYNNLAVVQAAAGDFDAAVSTLKDALATHASYQTAYENLTRIFAQLASEAYSRALEVDSPPAREQVELEMLADLSAPAVPPTFRPLPRDETAERKLTPAEPMPAVPAEPPGAAESEAPSVPEPVAPAAVESEDLEVAEIAAPATASEPAAEESEPAALVDRWARAWSEQRIEEYLAFYADDFLPANGMSRTDWEEYRRDRIGAPEFIKVEVKVLDSASESPDRAQVTFVQAYESNTYSDQVTKTLTLVRDGSDWKILEEKSGS